VKILRGLGFQFLPSVPKTYAYAPMSVNDICCMMPPWFASVASVFTGLITYEATRSVNASVVAVGIMAVIPAHLMRSLGGEFDNECVAMSTICITFWLWMRSVRTPNSWPVSIWAGLSYIFMVATCGGYIFVINMIGVHALMLVGLGRFNSGVHKAYTLFFVIGTAGAIQIPVVGMQPLRSLEQIGPLLVFLGFQVLEYCDFQRKRNQLLTKKFIMLRLRCMLYMLAALVAVAALLWPTGYFGPLSARIRGLFVKHTKTGNPLVDSVAEHQPASLGVYQSYLNWPLEYAFLGVIVLLLKRNNASYFVMLYGVVAMHFSAKMSRLILICAPICTIVASVYFGFVLDFILEPFFLLLGKPGYKASGVQTDNGTTSNGASGKGTAKAGAKKTKAKAKVDHDYELSEWEEEQRLGGMAEIKRKFKTEIMGNLPDEADAHYKSFRQSADSESRWLLGRMSISVLLVIYFLKLSGLPNKAGDFVDHCHSVAKSLANPKVMFMHRNQQGQEMLVDDYYKGYKWVDANTPQDSRVIAWWDYGYQITGIAKRTSIADGNTWNHEHIATLGRTLTSPEKKAWNAIRHMADYLLVWAGGRGDDLAKSPHLARIGNSVFPEHCGDDDPKCSKFGFNRDGTPTPMMAESLLYKAVTHKTKPNVKLNPRYFKEVHTTKHQLMRVYKVMNISEESKAWIADPANRVCDAPGSWYCVGQYPPALSKLISKRRNFAQVGDFNADGSQGPSAYTKMIEKERSGKADL